MIKNFNVPIYGQKIVFCSTEKEAEKLYGQKETCDGCESYKDGRYLIFVNSDKFGGIDLSTLSHECVHCAFDMLDNLGIPVNTDTQEALAYLQDFIFGSILRWAVDLANKDKLKITY